MPTVPPFKITAAGSTIGLWTDGSISIGVWIITTFLVLPSAIQIFGGRGYGEVDFILSIIKIAACTGFIIFGIITDTGGIPTRRSWMYRRQILAAWSGIQGCMPWVLPGVQICSVFVNAAFAFDGTELVGLFPAEAETPENPPKAIPTASKQVFWRTLFFYVVDLLPVGPIIPSDFHVLLVS